MAADQEHASRRADVWGRVVGAEGNLAGWLNASLLLLGNALLFYHMVTSRTLEANRRQAGLIACAFVAASLGVLLTGTATYVNHTRGALSDLPARDRPDEKVAFFSTQAGAVYLGLLFAAVAGLIFSGSMRAF